MGTLWLKDTEGFDNNTCTTVLHNFGKTVAYGEYFHHSIFFLNTILFYMYKYCNIC